MILTVWQKKFCSCWRDILFCFFTVIFFLVLSPFYLSFWNSAVFFKTESLWNLLFFFHQVFLSFFSHPYCFVLYFLDLLLLELIFFTFTFFRFLDNNFPSLLYQKKNFSIYPFLQWCVSSVLLVFILLFICCLFSLSSRFLFSIAFDFLFFLMFSLSMTSFLNMYLDLLQFGLCTFLWICFTYLCVFAWLSFLSFFPTKKVSIFFSCVFWTFSILFPFLNICICFVFLFFF